MLFVARPPAVALAPFVDYLWSLRDRDAPHARERIVPSGTLELVVNLDEDELRVYDGDRCRRLSGVAVSGAYRRYFVIDTREHASIVGVHFRPGGAFALLGVEPGALVDQHVDLEALWGRSARELRERLCSAPSEAQRFAILEQVLLARLSTPRRRHPAVAIAIERLCQPGASIGDIADEVQLSHRRLIELFTREVGMTPKLFGTVRRFERALSQAQATSLVDWARLAAACGYFDQSHMIRDFTRLAGSSPAEMLRHTRQVKAHHAVVPSNPSNPAAPRSATLRGDAHHP
jgi:AraC-like DNA-binding protein